MVRFSSNIKRPKAIAKQNHPLLSKEAPPTTTHQAQKQKFNRQSINFSHGHAHSRSLPSNPHQISLIPEIGLTSQMAIKKLIEEIDRVLLTHEKSKNNQIYLLPLLRYLSLFLLAFLSVWKRESRSFGLFCALISGCEIFFIEFLEKMKSQRAVSGSIKRIRNNLRKLDKLILSGTIHSNSLYSINFNVPITSATNYIRVIRDGKVRFICLNLLVPGDFVVILAGEKASNLFQHFQPLNLSLSPTQKKNLGIPIDASIVQIDEFPVTQVFEDQLRIPRRTRFIFSILQEKLQTILSIGIILISGIRLEHFNNLILIPLIMISSPILRLFWWLTSTCYLSLLSDQLIRSETPFSENTMADSQDVDEFDEDAPPPVKNIKIPFWKVLLEVFKEIFGFDSGKEGRILRLWDGDVIEALALTSVLCFTDREGPISNSHSRPCELIIPTTSESELVAIELIPKISDPQAVRPLLNNPLVNLNPSDLRAIGLSMLLSSDCGKTDGIGPHCRHQNILNELCHNLPEYLQTCYCNLAKEIGFDTSILNRFKQIKTIWHQNHHHHHNATSKHYKKSSTVSVLVEDQLALFNAEEEESSPIGHLFTFGEVHDVLKLCLYAYSREESGTLSKITEMSESLKRKLIDFEETMRSCDVHCVSFCYRPIFGGESSGQHLNELLSAKNQAQSHVFLGLISVCPEPKEHFQEFIDDLEAAGVRFAYFSPYREQVSKAFGERLGLETDWNSCILLSEHPNPSSQSPGYSALSDIKAKLPRGIQAIRPHLESVDDIPLHVSIFAECNAQNAAEMIKIYQESGEIVSIIGSCRSIRNSNCFSTAHLSIGNDPLSKNNANNKIINDNLNFDEISFQINSNSVKIVLPADSSPYIITELIRESRTILQNSINAWEFIIGSLLSFSLISGRFSAAGDLKSVLFIVASVFLVGIGIILGPHDAVVMKTHSTVLDTSKCPQKISFSFLFSTSLVTIFRFVPNFIFLLIAGRSLLGCLIILLSQSFSFIHSYEAIRISDSKLVYTIVSGCILILLVYDIIMKSLYNTIISLFISILLGLICVTWHETIKSVHLRDHYDQSQKRAKLLFNTKLGMHSPV